MITRVILAGLPGPSIQRFFTAAARLGGTASTTSARPTIPNWSYPWRPQQINNAKSRPRFAQHRTYTTSPPHPQLLLKSSRSSYYPLLLALVVPIAIGSSALLLDSDSGSGSGAGDVRVVYEGAKKLEEHEFLIPAGQDAARQNTMVHRLGRAIQLYILEPLSTTTRFIHLVVLFLPVILAAPILALEWVGNGSQSRRRIRTGASSKRGGSERETTRWWYRLLVAQMARAGPTFIKVSSRALLWGETPLDNVI